MTKKTRFCSFCGNEANINEHVYLIQGIDKNVFICTTCVADCMDVASQYKFPDSVSIKKILADGFKPSTVKNHLDQYVIEQEHAKMVLAVAVYNHYKFIEYKKRENPLVEMEKSNILIVGPTGSGKTMIARQLAKILNVPFAMADATSLTQAGYVGDDPENVLRALVQNADGDIAAAERGIVYIDEIDKIARKSENMSISRDVSGEGVQQALLKIIEGSVVEIPAKGYRKHPNAATIKIDTTNILFIVGGSFEGIDNIIAKRLRSNKSSIGFGSDLYDKNAETFNNYILDVKVEDVKKFGIIPELVGRLPIICPLKELTEESLLRILTEPKNALVKQYQQLVKFENIELKFTDEALRSIARKAIERKTGARALRSIMEESLLKYMYELPELKNVAEVIITDKVIDDNELPEYVYLEELG